MNHSTTCITESQYLCKGINVNFLYYSRVDSVFEDDESAKKAKSDLSK